MKVLIDVVEDSYNTHSSAKLVLRYDQNSELVSFSISDGNEGEREVFITKEDFKKMASWVE